MEVEAESISQTTKKAARTSTIVRVARYTLVRILVLFITVVIAIFLTIMIANMGGKVDTMMRADIEFSRTQMVNANPAQP